MFFFSPVHKSLRKTNIVKQSKGIVVLSYISIFKLPLNTGNFFCYNLLDLKFAFIFILLLGKLMSNQLKKKTLLNFNDQATTGL